MFLVLVYIAEKYVVPASVRGKRDADEKLHEFTTDVVYDPYPKPRTVENHRDCTVHTLQKCSMSDETSVFGCRELTARCHHFDADTPYVEYNDRDGREERVVVPKNSTADEGYALAVTNIEQSCNPYHGDLVLVAKQLPDVRQPETFAEYMFVCVCKNPGYIGNDDILGNCSTVRVCGGRVQNLNVPLSRMHCVCNEYEEAYTYKVKDTYTPACKPLSVRSANAAHDDWSFLVPWNEKYETLGIDKFHTNIARNVRSSKLLNPCVHDVRNAGTLIPGARFDTILATCTVDGYGIPVRTGTLRTAAEDPAKVGARYGNLDAIDGVIGTGEYHKIRILDNVSNYRQMGAIVAPINFNIEAGKFTATRQPNEVFVVALPPNTSFGNPGHVRFSKNIAQNLQAPNCTPFIYWYSCKIQDNFKEISKQNLPVPYVNNPPPAFLWGTDNWEGAYDMFRKGLVENGHGLELINAQLNKYGDVVRFYGYQIVSSLLTTENNGLVGFTSRENYDFGSGYQTA